MIALEDALTLYAKHLRALPVETVPIHTAAQRVLAEPICSVTDLPRIDQSAMDGYALRAADTARASVSHPLRLPIAGEIAAGSHEALAPLMPATVMRIFTGAPIPLGADTVIAQERATREGDVLLFSAPVVS